MSHQAADVERQAVHPEHEAGADDVESLSARTVLRVGKRSVMLYNSDTLFDAAGGVAGRRAVRARSASPFPPQDDCEAFADYSDGGALPDACGVGDIPDPLPDKKNGVTPGKLSGFQKAGTGRQLGSRIDVRYSLCAVAIVVIRRDVLDLLFSSNAANDFGPDAHAAVLRLHGTCKT